MLKLSFPFWLEMAAGSSPRLSLTDEEFPATILDAISGTNPALALPRQCRYHIGRSSRLVRRRVQGKDLSTNPIYYSPFQHP
jgi:hypothetical protein